ncbi:kinase-like protein [Dendrothele bispora CBS 962.96]|uniref:Kinase-like protein n=1 Tax=Dendrothele bispora (strain CBS 962.96) TaxID=1314807 RepID=A0A4S8M2N1_DENBC|nr:kinase-like protein [Dendrothele bispora CBS 962.96]
MNTTNGDLIAVKQFKLPRTAAEERNQHCLQKKIYYFTNEIKVLKNLNHPQIVQYLGWVVTPGYLTLVLEYVSGETIASCLTTNGPFQEEITKSFSKQLLGVLEYLHRKGIIHHGLHSENVLVDYSGRCKITDFGSSQLTDGPYYQDPLEMEGGLFWMAPELFYFDEIKKHNGKTDIWSLGCVVLEMWSGLRPWNKIESYQAFFKLAEKNGSPLVPNHVHLDTLGIDFVSRCFEREPIARASAEELSRHPYLVESPDWKFDGFGTRSSALSMKNNP